MGQADSKLFANEKANASGFEDLEKGWKWLAAFVSVSLCVGRRWLEWGGGGNHGERGQSWEP